MCTETETKQSQRGKETHGKNGVWKRRQHWQTKSIMRVILFVHTYTSSIFAHLNHWQSQSCRHSWWICSVSNDRERTRREYVKKKETSNNSNKRDRRRRWNVPRRTIELSKRPTAAKTATSDTWQHAALQQQLHRFNCEWSRELMYCNQFFEHGHLLFYIIFEFKMIQWIINQMLGLCACACPC